MAKPKKYHYVCKITELFTGYVYVQKRSSNVTPELDPFMGSGVRIVSRQKKYGKENYRKTILKTFKTEIEAFEFEAFIVDAGFLRFNNVLNFVYGGGGKVKIDEDEMEKSICNIKYCSKKGGGFKIDLPAILYYLRVEDFKGNVAYKIGITNRTVSQRYGASDMTKITVLSELEFKVGMNAYKEEQKILKEFADQKWDGVDLLKNGNTELFKTDVLGLDK